MADCWESAWSSEGACEAAAILAKNGDSVESDHEARRKAIRWVGQLDGNGRSDRISSCGWMELMFHPSSGGVGWRHRWCRDRACPGCARRRANELRHQLRAHLSERRTTPGRGWLAFVTLTHPKRSLRTEGPGAATTRLLDEWRKLTNRRAFKTAVLGYVRAVEVTYSKRGFPGWHAHIHVVLEIHAEIERVRIEQVIRRMWCSIVGGDEKAQNWQRLSHDRLGQVVKYVTKPFELPEHLAPTFFDEMKGRRLISAGGTWKDFPKHDEDFQAAPGWIPQSAHVAELADMAGREGGIWVFQWLVTEEGPKGVCPWRQPDEDELVCQRAMDASQAWCALKKDPRPVPARVKAPRSGALDPGESIAAAEKPHAPAQPGAPP